MHHTAPKHLRATSWHLGPYLDRMLYRLSHVGQLAKSHNREARSNRRIALLDSPSKVLSNKQ